MGHFVYQSADRPWAIDDRTVAHLRLVVMTKLRRDESFMLCLITPSESERWFWMDAAVPIQFVTTVDRDWTINHAWIDALMRSANSADGMRILPEPPPDASGLPAGSGTRGLSVVRGGVNYSVNG